MKKLNSLNSFEAKVIKSGQQLEVRGGSFPIITGTYEEYSTISCDVNSNCKQYSDTHLNDFSVVW